MGICCVHNNVIEPKNLIDFPYKKKYSNLLNRNISRENEKLINLKENEKKNK